MPEGTRAGSRDGPTEATTAIVLAGGRSRRMGRPKPFLSVGGRGMLERALDATASCREALVVVSPTEEERYARAVARLHPPGSGADRVRSRSIRVLTDPFPDAGPLAGIASGLRAASQPHAWVLACDLPLVPATLGERLLALLEDYDVAVPHVGDRLQPLCAVYRTGPALAAARRCLEAGVRAASELLPGLRRREVGEEELEDLGDPARMLLNVNRPGDLARAREAAGEGGGPPPPLPSRR